MNNLNESADYRAKSILAQSLRHCTKTIPTDFLLLVQIKMPMKFLIFLLFPVIIFGQNPYDKAQKLIDQKQFKKAENVLETHLQTHPDDLQAVELLGDAYGNQEKWDNAIEQYQLLVEADSNEANYQYKYGGSLGMKALKVNKLRALTMIDDIKEAFTKAAELDPNHVETRWALVELYMQLPGIVGGSVDKAMHYANELQNISRVDGYLAKGYIYEQDNEPKLAESHYKQAIETGGSMVCYEKLTEFYENQKQPLKAIENLEEAQIKHQRNALHYQIGKVAAEYNIALDKGEICLLTYIKNYTIADGVPIAWAHYRLAQIYKMKGEKQDALQHIDLAISDLPKIKTFVSEKEEILRL